MMAPTETYKVNIIMTIKCYLGSVHFIPREILPTNFKGILRQLVNMEGNFTNSFVKAYKT